MNVNVGREMATLERMTVRELRGRYADIFGETTRAANKAWMVKRILWRLQALAEGDLSQRAHQRAAELARDADVRLSAPKQLPPATAPATRVMSSVLPVREDQRLPLPGTLITREYKGRTLHVQVLPRGFEFEGEIFKSLSAVAKRITGQHCNGYFFFRLNKETRA